MNNNRVSEHYFHGGLLKDIQTAIEKLGKTIETITIEDLAPVDEFHIGGRAATEHFLKQLKFSNHDYVLDIGCGLGGAARYVANTYGSQVAGIDLTSEYIETGNTLATWVKLDKQIHLKEASALAIPFKDETFSGSYMMHVGMNIEDKSQLFTEVYRALQPGATFGIYDIMQIGEGAIDFPVPWASEKNMSFLTTSKDYQEALHNSGFSVSKETIRHQFALDFFKRQREKTKTQVGPPPLGLHTLMQNTTATKIKNMVHGIVSNHIAPVEIIACKPSKI